MSLSCLLNSPGANLGWGWLTVAILGRTFLHTGLFVVGHDAMHGSVCPQYPRCNDFIGQVATGLYACLPFQSCRDKHWAHHRHPGQWRDPDFHPGQTAHPVGWYLRFLQTYLTPMQLGRLVLQWGLLLGLLSGVGSVPAANLWWFWVLPFLLSSVQLFIFGTYLPHRPYPHLPANRHHAVSSHWPMVWSFLSCYHFGYHWEHHEYPWMPWYGLPRLAQGLSPARPHDTPRSRPIGSTLRGMAK